MASTVGPGGYTTTYTYDDGGRQVGVTTPSGLTGIGDPATVTATTGYWPNGLVKSQTDSHVPVPGVPDPSERTFTYTPGGRLETVTDALGNTVAYNYDGRGNRISRTAWDDAADPQVQSWAYDLADRVTAATVPPPRVGASAMTTTYTYEPASGRLATVTDPDGRQTVFDHYESGQVRSRIHTSLGKDSIAEVFWLDARGNTTKSTSTIGTTTLTESSTFDRLGRPATVTAHTGDETVYTFDLAGQVSSFTYPDGAVAYYERDMVGQVVNVDIAASSSSLPVPWVEYTYDSAGRQTEMVSFASGGNTRTYDYDDAGRVVAFEQALKRQSGGWNETEVELSWRSDSRLATVTRNGGPTVTYDYDDAGQLISESGGAVERSWTYGTRGNRLTATEGTTTTVYTTNPNGSMASADDSSSVTTYSYDDAGRRIQAMTTEATATTRTVTTAWDSSGRTNGISDQTASGTAYEIRQHNTNGLVVRYLTNTFLGTHVWDNIWDTTRTVPQIINGSINGTLWLRADHTHERLNIAPFGAIQWFEYDEHHSVVNTGTPDPAIVNGPTSYDPYGNPDSTPAAYGYRSEATTLGLINLRNRTYDPQTGQFLTQDPLDGVDGTPTAANPYHYTDNDPLNKTDPLGLRPGDGAFEPPSDTDDRCLPGGSYPTVHFPSDLRERTYAKYNSQPWYSKTDDIVVHDLALMSTYLAWPGLPDAAENMHHFLLNTGNDKAMKVDKILNEVSGLRRIVEQEATRLASLKVDSSTHACNMYFTQTDWLSYSITPGESLNWFLAHGKANYLIQGYASRSDGGILAVYRVAMYDAYDWDPTDTRSFQELSAPHALRTAYFWKGGSLHTPRNVICADA